MKREHRTLSFSVLLLGLALGGCEERSVDEGPGVDRDTVAAAGDQADSAAAHGIDTLRSRYERAYNEGDVEAVVMLYTPRAEIRTAQGAQRGREEIREDLQASLGADTTAADPARGGASTRIAIRMADRTIATSGDVAYGHGTTTATLPDGGTEESVWMAGFRKVNGEWKIDRLLIAEPPADADPTM